MLENNVCIRSKKMGEKQGRAFYDDLRSNFPELPYDAIDIHIYGKWAYSDVSSDYFDGERITPEGDYYIWLQYCEEIDDYYEVELNPTDGSLMKVSVTIRSLQ